MFHTLEHITRSLSERNIGKIEEQIRPEDVHLKSASTKCVNHYQSAASSVRQMNHLEAPASYFSVRVMLGFFMEAYHTLCVRDSSKSPNISIR